MKSIFTFSFLFISLFVLSQQERKVLVIGIDGCRQDALQAAITPNIDVLIDNSLHSFSSTTQAPTWSGVGWSSMLTGVWGEKHGVSDNSFSGNNFSTYPHFFNLIKQSNPDLYLSSICQWGPINDNITDEGDNIQNTDSGQGVVDLAIEQLAVSELDVLFLHFDDVDHAGHSDGFSPDIPEYIEAIEGVDNHVGDVMNALNSRINIDQENWLVIISTDHGGSGTSHGGSSDIERNIFIIFSGDDYLNEELIPEYETTFSDSSNALNMNQVDVYGIVDNENLYDFGTDEDFTIELRIKTNGWTNDPSIISDKDWNSGYNPGYVLACMTNEESWKFNIGDNNNRIDLNGNTINDGEWHHIAVSVSRQNGIFTFQDGEIVSSTNQSFQGDISSGFPIAFGQDGTLNYPAEFDGWLDEIRIWNEALSEETLVNWSCDNLSDSHPNVDALLGYWKMEELGDFVTFDSTPNDNHMELVNGPYLSAEEAMTCTQQINELPFMVDIAPTALTHLCVEIEEDWELDGLSYAENMEGCTSSILEFDTTNNRAIVFPNPSTTIINFSWDMEGVFSFKLYDIYSRLVKLDIVSKGLNRVEVDGQTSGVYVFEIRNIEGQIVHREKLIFQ